MHVYMHMSIYMYMPWQFWVTNPEGLEWNEGLNIYQKHVGVCLRYLLLWLCSGYGTIILISIEAPTILHLPELNTADPTMLQGPHQF